jgi:positive regulator of sigma E activity
MSLPGKIIEVHEDHVIVEVSPRPECEGCHACKSLLDGEKKSEKKKITALKAGFEPEVGDEVILDTNPGEGSIAAILIFGVPMAAFFLGIYLSPPLLAYFNIIASEGSRLILGFLFMALAFLGLAAFSRTKIAKSLTLKISKICK